MEDKPFAQPKSKQKKSPMKMIVGVVVAILAVVAGLVFFSGGSDDGVEAPPELSTGSGYQGFLRTQRGLIEFDADDVDDFDLKCEEKVNLESGLRAVTFSKDMTGEEVFNHIVPVKGNKFIMVYYSPGETGKKMGWNLYPVGPYVAPGKNDPGYNPNSAITEIAEDDLKDFVIPAYRPVILGMTEDTDFCVTKEMKDDNIEVYPFDDTVSKTNIGSIEDLESGWALLPVQDVDTYGDLKYADQVKSIWAIKSDGFEYKVRRVGLTDAIDSDSWGVVWVNLKAPDAPAEPDPGQEEAQLGPVRDLDASLSDDGKNVTISWKKPADVYASKLASYLIDVNFKEHVDEIVEFNYALDIKTKEFSVLKAEPGDTGKINVDVNVVDDESSASITIPVDEFDSGKEYTFKVSAVDTEGQEGPDSSVKIKIPVAEDPGTTEVVANLEKVQNLEASLSFNKDNVVVSWDKPLNVDVAKLSSYNVDVNFKESKTNKDVGLSFKLDLSTKKFNIVNSESEYNIENVETNVVDGGSSVLIKIPVTELPLGNNYTFTVAAVDGSGKVGLQDSSNTVYIPLSPTQFPYYNPDNLNFGDIKNLGDLSNSQVDQLPKNLGDIQELETNDNGIADDGENGLIEATPLIQQEMEVMIPDNSLQKSLLNIMPTVIPEAPTNVNVEYIIDPESDNYHKLVLTWNVPDNEAPKYKIVIKKTFVDNPQNKIIVFDKTVDTDNVDDNYYQYEFNLATKNAKLIIEQSTLDKGFEYKLQVMGINDNGEGTPSEEVSFTVPFIIDNLKKLYYSTSFATIGWSPLDRTDNIPYPSPAAIDGPPENNPEVAQGSLEYDIFYSNLNNVNWTEIPKYVSVSETPSIFYSNLRYLDNYNPYPKVAVDLSISNSQSNDCALNNKQIKVIATIRSTDIKSEPAVFTYKGDNCE